MPAMTKCPARTRRTCCLKMNATGRKTGRARRGKGMPQCVPTPPTWPPVLRPPVLRQALLRQRRGSVWLRPGARVLRLPAKDAVGRGAICRRAALRWPLRCACCCSLDVRGCFPIADLPTSRGHLSPSNHTSLRDSLRRLSGQKGARCRLWESFLPGNCFYGRDWISLPRNEPSFIIRIRI